MIEMDYFSHFQQEELLCTLKNVCWRWRRPFASPFPCRFWRWPHNPTSPRKRMILFPIRRFLQNSAPNRSRPPLPNLSRSLLPIPIPPNRSLPTQKNPLSARRRHRLPTAKKSLRNRRAPRNIPTARKRGGTQAPRLFPPLQPELVISLWLRRSQTIRGPKKP